MAILDISNYWDDFERRVANTVDCICSKTLPVLDRLTVHITEKCNFRCTYCNMPAFKNEMDHILLNKIILEYADYNPGGIIHFTGGEPSIYPNFSNVCKFAKSVGLVVSANTNAATKIDCSNIDKLKVSLDTCDAEEFNKTCSSDTFIPVVENIQKYSREMRGRVLSITAVLNKKTYKNMAAFADFVCKNLNISNLYFSNYKGSNKDFTFSNNDIFSLSIAYIPATLRVFKKYGQSYSYKQLALYDSGDFKNIKKRFAENKTTPCYLQLSEMVIDVFGNCHNCSHLFRDGVVGSEIINVNNNSIKYCFEKLKHNLNNNYTYLSKKCLTGCNRNLIGFNKTVSKQINNGVK